LGSGFPNAFLARSAPEETGSLTASTHNSNAAGRPSYQGRTDRAQTRRKLPLCGGAISNKDGTATAKRRGFD